MKSSEISKEYLLKNYIDKKRSTADIAFELNVNAITIQRLLHKYHIQTRLHGRHNYQWYIGKILCDKCGNIKILKWKQRSKTCRSCAQKISKPKSKRITKYCLLCHKEFESLPYKNRLYCSCKCYNLSYKNKRAGDKNPGWKGGRSREPYPFIFDTNLKLRIRQRDNFQCMLCGKTEVVINRRMCIHHIDYNKNNCAINNLICLCHYCHSKTNYNREYYITHFQEFINGR